MTRLITFLSLIFVFSISFASADIAVELRQNDSAYVSKMTPDQKKVSAIISDRIALLPLPLLLTGYHSTFVQAQFRSPWVKTKAVVRLKTLPIIGWGNIDCYGGTCARYARG